MSRPLVEGQTRGNTSGTIPDLNAVITVPAPPTDVVYRDVDDGDHDDFSRPGVINNLDTGGIPSDHTFNYFLRGADVPGGALSLNPIISPAGVPTIAEATSGPTGALLPLIGDQRVEVEMLEAVDTVAPAFMQSWIDHYAPLDDLDVVPSVPGTQLATFDNNTPFVIAGPGTAFSTRTVFLTSPPALSVGTMIVNIDNFPITVLITLRDANGPDVLLATKAVAAGFCWHNTAAAMQVPATIDLKEGQSLEIATTTAPTTNDPYVWAKYADRI